MRAENKERIKRNIEEMNAYFLKIKPLRQRLEELRDIDIMDPEVDKLMDEFLRIYEEHQTRMNN